MTTTASCTIFTLTHQHSIVRRFFRWVTRRGEATDLRQRVPIEPRHEAIPRDHGTTSRPGVLHQRGDLHELDSGAHTIKLRHALKQLISKERFGGVF
jgi:hypothetical protein